MDTNKLWTAPQIDKLIYNAVTLSAISDKQTKGLVSDLFQMLKPMERRLLQCYPAETI